MKRRITLNLKIDEARNLLGHLQDSFTTNPKRGQSLTRTKSRLLFQFSKLKGQPEPKT